MVFQARGPSLMAALGPGVGICGRPGGLKKKVVLREMDVESPSKMDRDALMADTITGLLGDSAELPGSMIIPGICCPQTFVRTAERFMKQ